MDPDLKRLLALPGHDDLTVDDVAAILQVCQQTVSRMVRAEKLAAKLIQGRGRGCANRLRIPRIAVLKYIHSSHTDKSLILADITAYCPKALPYLQQPETTPPPANVLDITTGKPRIKRPTPDPYAGHPDLFSA